MPLELRRVEASDHDILERCIVVETAAFDSSHIKPIVYPGPFPPDADERRVAELSETLSKEPNIHFIAVADTEIEGPDAIVAWGKWMVYADGMPPPKERTFLPGMNFEAAKLMYGGIDSLRKNVEGLKCMCEYLMSRPRFASSADDGNALLISLDRFECPGDGPRASRPRRGEAADAMGR